MPPAIRPERFWESVYKTPNCWFWIGNRMKNGYGRFSLGYRRILAHRASWFFAYGVWPTQHVLHHCDIEQCVRPDHLFEGTNQENHVDAASKGAWGLKQNLREFCRQGHPLSGDNLYLFPNGYRACRQCRRQWARDFQERGKH